MLLYDIISVIPLKSWNGVFASKCKAEKVFLITLIARECMLACTYGKMDNG